MHLSTTDILIVLASIDVVICGVAGAVLILRRRFHRQGDDNRLQGAARRPEQPGDTVAYRPVSRGLLEDTGLHHVPEGLLDAPTTRLTPEVLSRLVRVRRCSGLRPPAC